MTSLQDAIALLALPFAASLVLIATHCQFGLQVIRRNVVFVDLALAQCAALGATVAYMQGHLPASPAAYAWSLGFAWVAALLLSLLRRLRADVPAEALVGVLYVFATAAALLLIERAPQGAEHLKQVLVGSVLTVGRDDVLRIIPLYAGISAALWLATRHRWLDRSGLAGWAADFGFYAAFGVVVTSSVAIAGVLLVFSFLIMPALIGMLCTQRPGRQLLIGWGAGTAAAAAGLAASYGFDTSTGATMVCTFTLALVLALTLRSAPSAKQIWRAALRFGAWAAGLLLVCSALWLAAKPRADQPLLDVAEALWPDLRKAYFSNLLYAVHIDAEQSAKRYTAETARLSAKETEGAPLDDETMQKLSSFQQSYNEMIKGEQMVMRETRSRAREQLRWPAGGLALGLCLLLALLAGRQR